MPPEASNSSGARRSHRAIRSHRRHRVLTPAVSRRRRITVLLLFLVLVGAIYVWLRLTDREAVQAMARAYLEDLLRGNVAVERASFDVFNGVWLYGVTVRLPDDPEVRDERGGKPRTLPVLKIGSVHLRHQPASLLVGKFVPREIIVSDPEINLVEFVESGRWNGQDLLATEGLSRGGGRPPIIRVRGGSIRFHQYRDGRLTGEGSREIFGHLAPDPQDRNALEFRFELPIADDPGDRSTVRGRIDVATARIHLTVRNLPLGERARSGMPARLRELLEGFAIGGSVDIGTSTVQVHSPRDVQWDMIGDLRGVSARVPVAGVDVALHGVRGRVGSTSRGLELTHLTGFIEGVPFTVPAGFLPYPDPKTGRFAGPIDLTVEIEQAHLPAVLGGRLHRLIAVADRHAARLHGHRNLTGRVSAVLRLTSASDASQPRPVVDIHVRDGTYFTTDFPYLIDDVTATLRVEGDRMRLLESRGRHGETELTAATGTFTDLTPYAGFDLALQARGARLDADLLNALDDVSREALEKLAPAGRFDVAGSVHRDPGPDALPQLTARLTLHDVTVRRTELGRPLEHLAGPVYVTPEGVQIREDDPLHFRRGPMTGTISGKLRTRGACPYAMQFDAKDVDLADAASIKLTPARQAALRELHLAGRADITAKMRGTLLGSAEPDFLLQVRLKDARLNWRQFPCPVSGVYGDVQIRKDRILLESLEGRRGEGKLRLSGTVMTTAENPTTELSLIAENMAFEEALRDALPADAKRAWQQCEPGGRFDCTYRIPVDKAGKLTAAGQIRLRQATAKFEGFPYALRNVVGRVDVAEDGTATIGSVTAEHGAARIRIEEGTLRPRGDSAEVDLTFTATGIRLDEDLRRALPWALRKHWVDLKPSGSVEVSRSRFVFKPADGEGGTGYASLELRPREGALQLGPRAEAVRGTVRLDTQTTADGRTFGLRGSFQLDALRYFKIALTDAKGTLEMHSARNVLRVSELSARAHGGHLAGSVVVQFKPEDTLYAVELAAKDVQLQGLGRQLFGEDFQHTGLLSGSLKINGRLKRSDLTRVEGHLLIEKANLFRLPAIINVLRFLNLRRPEQLSFNEATVRFFVRGNRVQFDELHLRGKAVAMLGAGYVDHQSRAMRLALVVGPPENLPRVPLLEDFLKGLHLALTQVEVTGTLEKPQIRTRPFSDLAQEIRDLLRRER